MSGKTPPSQGTETRGQILPSVSPDDTGFVLPNYDFAGNIPIPTDTNPGPGVRKGGSFGDIYSGAQGVAYYMDVVGFGASSSGLTRGKAFQPLGINFFMKSGLQCTNGADMWTYFQGIPKGDALGQSVQRASKALGWPELRGLAPGIMEDAKDALDIKPVLNAAFGSVYPVCEQVSLPVGDAAGNVMDKNTKEEWVKGPFDFKVEGGVRKPFQTKWVQKMQGGKPVAVSRGEFEAAKKTHNPDGTPKTTEAFEDGQKASLVLAVVLFSLAFAVNRMK
jgi:hypothetical protein